MPTADAGKGPGVLTPPSPCPSPQFGRRLAVMTGQAQGLQVVPIVRIAAVGNFLDVINDNAGFRSTFAQAFFTQRMGASVCRSEFSPFRRLIKIMADRTGSVVLFSRLGLFHFQIIFTGNSWHDDLSETNISIFCLFREQIGCSCRFNASRTAQIEIRRAFKGKVPEKEKQGLIGRSGRAF